MCFWKSAVGHLCVCRSNTHRNSLKFNRVDFSKFPSISFGAASSLRCGGFSFDIAPVRPTQRKLAAIRYALALRSSMYAAPMPFLRCPLDLLKSQKKIYTKEKKNNTKHFYAVKGIQSSVRLLASGPAPVGAAQSCEGKAALDRKVLRC